MSFGPPLVSIVLLFILLCYMRAITSSHLHTSHPPSLTTAPLHSPPLPSPLLHIPMPREESTAQTHTLLPLRHSRLFNSSFPSSRESIPPKRSPPTSQLTSFPFPFQRPARSKMSKMRLGVRRAESPPLAEHESGVGIGGNSLHNPYICLTHLSNGVIIPCVRTNTLVIQGGTAQPRGINPGAREDSTP